MMRRCLGMGKASISVFAAVFFSRYISMEVYGGLNRTHARYEISSVNADDREFVGNGILQQESVGVDLQKSTNVFMGAMVNMYW